VSHARRAFITFARERYTSYESGSGDILQVSTKQRDCASEFFLF
jgi:hypothetical protein